MVMADCRSSAPGDLEAGLNGPASAKVCDLLDLGRSPPHQSLHRCSSRPWASSKHLMLLGCPWRAQAGMGCQDRLASICMHLAHIFTQQAFRASACVGACGRLPAPGADLHLIHSQHLKRTCAPRCWPHGERICAGTVTGWRRGCARGLARPALHAERCYEAPERVAARLTASACVRAHGRLAARRQRQTRAACCSC